jgi:hypothetical protein
MLCLTKTGLNGVSMTKQAVALAATSVLQWTLRNSLLAIRVMMEHVPMADRRRIVNHRVKESEPLLYVAMTRRNTDIFTYLLDECQPDVDITIAVDWNKVCYCATGVIRINY